MVSVSNCIYKTGGKRYQKSKAKELIEVIRNDPFNNPPPYERLVGNLDGFYSRRINIKHRLVYQVYGDKIESGNTEFEGTIKIVRMWTHYEGMR